MGLIDSLTAVAVAIGSIVVAVGARLIWSEIDAWTPRLIDWLIKRAVERLPSDIQSRMDEEWRTFINDTPGKIVKLLRAFGLTRAANDIVQGELSTTFAEQVFSRAFGAAALLFFFPFMFIASVALFIEKPGPLFSKVTMRKNPTVVTYVFLLRTGPVSQFLRRTNTDTMPWLISYVRGDVVIKWTVWKRAIAQAVEALLDLLRPR